jgi:hypothetical protein
VLATGNWCKSPKEFSNPGAQSGRLPPGDLSAGRVSEVDFTEPELRLIRAMLVNKLDR